MSSKLVVTDVFSALPLAYLHRPQSSGFKFYELLESGRHCVTVRVRVSACQSGTGHMVFPKIRTRRNFGQCLKEYPKDPSPFVWLPNFNQHS